MGEVGPPGPEAERPGADPPVTCPWCGAREAERMSAFGPQLLSSQYLCRRCGSPFEVIRARGSQDRDRRPG